MSEDEKKNQDHPWGERNEHYHGEGALPPSRKIKTHWIVLGLLLLFAVFLLLFIVGILTRSHQKKTLRKNTDTLAAPTVQVVNAQKRDPQQEIVLPSNIQPFTDAPIYARTSGYLGKWYYDIGAHVAKGALLAKIESPEVDQQLAQAKADLQTAEANAKLANITAQRYTELYKSDSVAKQDVDNAVQQAAAQNANVKAQQANVNRLEQLVGFERVEAPFTGIVTQRNTDVGQLINAGNGGGAQELFHMQDIHILRVFVNVPQAYSLDAHVGSPAYITIDTFPNQKFWGKIARTANSIAVPTRTLNVEVDVDNKDGKLYAGAYSAVHIPVRQQNTSYSIPVSALIFRSKGLQVATVVNNDTLKLVPVVAGRDYGTDIEILSGLNPGDKVVENPPDSGVSGSKVRIVQPDNKQGQSGGGNQGQAGEQNDKNNAAGFGNNGGSNANTGPNGGTGTGVGQNGGQNSSNGAGNGESTEKSSQSQGQK